MPSSLGPAEILVILVVALIVLGPAKLPEAGRQVGRALAEVRRWTRDVQSEVRGAFDPDAKPPTYTSPMPTTVDVTVDPSPSAAPTAPLEDFDTPYAVDQTAGDPAPQPTPEDPVVTEPSSTPGPEGEATAEPPGPVPEVPEVPEVPAAPAEAPPDDRR